MVFLFHIAGFLLCSYVGVGLGNGFAFFYSFLYSIVRLVVVFKLGFKKFIEPGKIQAVVAMYFCMVHVMMRRWCFEFKQPVAVKVFGVNFVAQVRNYI